MTHEEFIDNYLTNIGWYITNDVLYIKKYLDFEKIKITSLPDNLYINGSLNLFGCNITELPNNLHIRNWLEINGTYINYLPDDIYIGEVWNNGWSRYNKLISCCEKVQLDLISKNSYQLERFTNPTEKAKALHNLLWEI